MNTSSTLPPEAAWRIREAINRQSPELVLANQGLLEFPPELVELTWLTKLNLAGNALTEIPADIARLAALESLDLGRNRLGRLPEHIGDLSQLQQLDVYDNQLTALPERIGDLSQLQSLYVFGNQLTALPESIGDLTELQELYVWNNQLTTLPERIGDLTQLQQLIAWNNQLAALPERIGDLVQLQHLVVYENQLTALPERICELTQLQLLDVSDNQLTALPERIGDLTKLQELSAWGNQITALSERIGDLTQLQQLHVWNNQLTALPERIGDLTQLQGLYVFDNQLTALPERIGDLTQLRRLDVSNNQLNTLPERIGDLTQLQQLDVSNNQLAALPNAVGAIESLGDLDASRNRLTTLPASLKNARLDWLMVQGNPLLGIPDSIAGKYVEAHQRSGETGRKRAKAVIAHYFRARELDGKPLAEVKLLLVGRGEGGKTALVRALKGLKFARTRETEGIDIQRWPLLCGDLEVRVNVWDFAGQVITHATHQFFMTERSVYILVLTGRSDLQKADADRWLKLIQAFGSDEEGRTSPVIVALNKWDGHPFKLDRNGIQQKYPFVVGFVETDCRTGLGIDSLREILRTTIGGMAEVRQPFPLPWWDVKEAIEKAQRRQNYMPFASFRALCAERGEDSPEQQQVLSTVFHALGIALNYGSDERLRDATVLNPRWVTEGIYKLLRHAVRDDGSGELTLHRVAQTLPGEPENMRRYLVELMRLFKLAFPLDESGDLWLVPQRLPEEQPQLGDDWSIADATRLRYLYPVIPEGLIPSLITRTYPLSEGDQEGSSLPRWVNGVVLADQGARALVKSDPEERVIHATVTGELEARRRLLGVIRSDFKAIHDEISGLNPKLEMELTGEPDVWVPIETLEADERHRQASSAQTQRGTIPVDTVQELNRLSLPAARDRDQWRARVFISYSSSDAKQMDQLLIRLKPMQATEGLIEVWTDRCIDPGAEWDGEIKKELDSADLILLLVSARFLASDYIRGVEVKRAVELANEGRALLVPIVLEDCGWTSEAFGHFNGLPRKGKPIRNTTPQRDGWEAVRKELQELVARLGDRRRYAGFAAAPTTEIGNIADSRRTSIYRQFIGKALSNHDGTVI